MAYILDQSSDFIGDFAGDFLEDFIATIGLLTGMAWSDQKTRIRRFLRDPGANIWNDDFLLNIFNDEQFDIQNRIGSIEDVRVINVPPRMQSAYLWDWEWPYNDNDNGEVWLVGYYDDSNQYVCSYIWEIEHNAGFTPTTDALGSFYTHPWEAWSAATPGEPPPFSFPTGFYRMKFIAWDRKPLDAITLKELQDRDFTWKTRKGVPLFYFRDETVSNRFYLYPFPSSISWAGTTTVDADPDEAEYATTSLDVDDNLICIYDKDPTMADSSDDTSDFPAYLRKYIEYGVVSRAYGANTDGRIPSLSEYWAMRKQVGLQIAKRYLSNRKSDRDYRLEPTTPQPIRSYRHPRLPGDYPSVRP